MAEKEGFEPPRRFRPPGFQDQSLQPDLGISPQSQLLLRQKDYNTLIFIVSTIIKKKRKNSSYFTVTPASTLNAIIYDEFC